MEESAVTESLPPEPPKPSDLEMLKNIDVLAAFVVKNGPQFESMARARQAGDPKFAFLFENDVGPDAIIGHEFYKWKKQSLYLQAQLEGEDNITKNCDQGKFLGRMQQAKRQPALHEEVPGSPTMSDMDMEDDFAMPSPKRDPFKQLGDSKAGTDVEVEHLSARSMKGHIEPGKLYQGKAMASGGEKFSDVFQIHGLFPRATEGHRQTKERVSHIGEEYKGSLVTEPPKPGDPEMLRNIEALAAFVVNDGSQVENFTRAKQAGNPKFAFLFEGHADPEAAIGHEFYKWKKRSLEVQIQREAENMASKHLDQRKFHGHVQPADHMAERTVLPNEVLRVQSVSDMDMEDKKSSLKRESIKQLGDTKVSVESEQLSPRRAASPVEEFPEEKTRASEVEKFPDVPQKKDRPLQSDTVLMRGTREGSPLTLQRSHLARENRGDPEKTHILNRNEPMQARQTEARSSLILDNSLSDTTDVSGDWELPHSVDKPGNRPDRSSSQQKRQTEQGVVILDQVDNMSPLKAISQYADKSSPRSPGSPIQEAMPMHQGRPGTKISRWGSPRSTQLLQPTVKIGDTDGFDLVNMNEPSQAGGRGRREEHTSLSLNNSFRNVRSASRDLERPWNMDRTGDRGSEYGRTGADLSQHRDHETVHVDEFGRLVREGFSESDSDEARHLSNRKRRSHSRSRSRSRSQSRSSGDSRWRRRSFSPSPRKRGRWSRSRSRSPRWRRSYSRTPPRDFRRGGPGRGDWDWRGDRGFQERGRRGGRGSGPNVCFNYARGRCFRGSSCRYLHQERKAMMQERDFWMHDIQFERPEVEASAEGVEVGREGYVLELREVETADKLQSGVELNTELNEAGEPVSDTELTAIVKAEVYTEGKTDVSRDVVEKPQASEKAVLVVEPNIGSEMKDHKESKVSIEIDSAEDSEPRPKVDTETGMEWSLPRDNEEGGQPCTAVNEKVDTETGIEWSLLQDNEEGGQRCLDTGATKLWSLPQDNEEVGQPCPDTGATKLEVIEEVDVKVEVELSLPQDHKPEDQPCKTESSTQLDVAKEVDAEAGMEWSPPHENKDGDLPVQTEGRTDVDVPGKVNAKAGVDRALPQEGEAGDQSFQSEGKTKVEVAVRMDDEAGVEWSLPQELQSGGELHQSEPSRGSISALAPLPALPPPPLLPFSQSRPMGHSIPMGNSSLVGQPYMSTGHLYPPGDLPRGPQQPNSLPHHLPPGNVPQYGPFRQLVNNTVTSIGHNFLPPGNSNLQQPFPGGSHYLGPQPTVFGGNPGMRQPYPIGSSGSIQQAFLPEVSINETPPLSQNHRPSLQPSYGMLFPAQPSFAQNPILTHQSMFPPQNQPLTFPSNPASVQAHGIPAAPITQGHGIPATSIVQGHGPGSSLPLPLQQSPFPRPFASDSSKQFTFPGQTNNGLQDIYPRALLPPSIPPTQNTMPWLPPHSLESPAPLVTALPPRRGESSSYLYSLTTIPPLSNLIKLPGVPDLSTSGDQYDPLSDSLDPGPSGALKSVSSIKAAEGGRSTGALPNTMVPGLENVSPGLDMEKANILNRKRDNVEAEIANINEAAADPGVGIVENVSPPDDNRNWSPGRPGEGTETGQDQAQSKMKKSSRGLKLLRSAVAEYVKEVLKPTWREGHMGKEAFKTIAKKAVDKVIGTLPSHHIPKSQEKVDQFMTSSRSKISKLVQGYVDKYLKA